MTIMNMVGGGSSDEPRVYGFEISIPSGGPTVVTYPESIFGMVNNAYGKIPASGTGVNCLNDWAGCPLISGIKRQVISSSIVNPGETDFVDVTDPRASMEGSSDTDVFTYFPTWFLRMEHVGTTISVAFSDKCIDGTWQDYAGSVGSNRVGHFRLGCFCSPVSNAVKSYGGTTPANMPFTNAIIYTQNNRGVGFDIMTWYQWTYLTALMTLLYKTTDLQSALANGATTNNTAVPQTALEFENDYGMYGSTTSTTDQMAFFWLQNIYGNRWQACGGAILGSYLTLATDTGYSPGVLLNTSKTNPWPKKYLTATYTSTYSGFIKNVTGTTETGFFPLSTGDANYFGDYAYMSSSGNGGEFPLVGGGKGDGIKCGPYYVYFNQSITSSGGVPVRLSYRL